jgi:hypothetical protein
MPNRYDDDETQVCGDCGLPLDCCNCPACTVCGDVAVPMVAGICDRCLVQFDKETE